MKLPHALAIFCVATASCNQVHASESLAAKYACVACHQATQKTVGPAWLDIATKYADRSKTAIQLAESIKKGGSGKWGPVPMPAQTALSDAEAQSLAHWVLSQKK